MSEWQRGRTVNPLAYAFVGWSSYLPHHTNAGRTTDAGWRAGQVSTAAMRV